MHEAAQLLVGENDFTSFRAAGCQSRTAQRNIMAVKVFRLGAFIIVDIKANAFLQHMVRNIAGSLLQVGSGQREPAWMSELLSNRDRCLAGKTAPPHGLYLVQVEYPAESSLPAGLVLPSFLNTVQ